MSWSGLQCLSAYGDEIFDRVGDALPVDGFAPNLKSRGLTA
jgi:hypothetical protein